MNAGHPSRKHQGQTTLGHFKRIAMRASARQFANRSCLVGAACCLTSCGIPSPPAQTSATVDTFRVIRSYPHDAAAYTQGLIFHNGFLYESTGLNGQSTLRQTRLETGEIVRQQHVDAAHFTEGLAESDGQLVQLTWRSNVAFVYDLADFSRRRTFKYPGEGWGLTRDEAGFILSDGTEYLRFLDPNTFREVRRVTVTDGGMPVRNLNELEYIHGEVYANVWHTDRIARISPQDGRVLGWLDLKGLISDAERRHPEAVLNGIAYDAASHRLFVTGKLWPRLFEIAIVPRSQTQPTRDNPRLHEEP